MIARKPRPAPRPALAGGTRAGAKPKGALRRVARGTLFAVTFTAAQLSEEASFFGGKLFDASLVDRLHTTLTRYHE
jgi:hypothetical protein